MYVEFKVKLMSVDSQCLGRFGIQNGVKDSKNVLVSQREKKKKIEAFDSHSAGDLSCQNRVAFKKNGQHHCHVKNADIVIQFLHIVTPLP